MVLNGLRIWFTLDEKLHLLYSGGASHETQMDLARDSRSFPHPAGSGSLGTNHNQSPLGNGMSELPERRSSEA
jgi:hypothetical protein